MDQRASALPVRSSGTSARLHPAPTLSVCSSSASFCRCWWWSSATGGSCWRCAQCRCGCAHQGACSPPFAERGGSDCCTFCDLQVGGASGERRESRVLQMVVCMVAGYLLCWMPYGAVAMLASFGPPGAVPPTASLIPSLLAKTSTVLNPVIYVRLNHQVVMATLFALIKRNHNPLFFFFFKWTSLSSAGASCTWSVGAPRPLPPRSTRRFQPAGGCGYKFPACQAWSKILQLPRRKHSRAAQILAALYVTSISKSDRICYCTGVFLRAQSTSI